MSGDDLEVRARGRYPFPKSFAGATESALEAIKSALLCRGFADVDVSRLEAQQPTGEQPTPPECPARPSPEAISEMIRFFRGGLVGYRNLRKWIEELERLSTPCSPCPTNFQGLWSQVLQCFQDTRPSVGDAYRLKMLLVEHEKEQG